MQRDAKATHLQMLHQFVALWTKGMQPEAVDGRILSLNDLCIPGEMTFTDFESE